MARELHDHYFKQAKRDGYLSRAAYKLIEIDDKKTMLKPGMAVLDCGAAPGSWCQVAGQRVGQKGVVIGVDLKPINHNFPNGNVITIESDLRDFDPSQVSESLGDRKRFDVVLSDMAPSTTGERTIDHHGSVRLCQFLLDQIENWLRPGGDLVMKVFEGEAYATLLERTRRGFSNARGYKPAASRDVSTEMYIVATGFLGTIPELQADDDLPPGFELPTRKPSAGWGG